MKLVWDSDQFVIAINQLSIHIAPEQYPPFDVVANIKEQDISLILEPAVTSQFQSLPASTTHSHSIVAGGLDEIS